MVDMALIVESSTMLVVGAKTDVMDAVAQRRYVGKHRFAVVVHAAGHQRQRRAEPQPVENFLGRNVALWSSLTPPAR